MNNISSINTQAIAQAIELFSKVADQVPETRQNTSVFLSSITDFKYILAKVPERTTQALWTDLVDNTSPAQTGHLKPEEILKALLNQNIPGVGGGLLPGGIQVIAAAPLAIPAVIVILLLLLTGCVNTTGDKFEDPCPDNDLDYFSPNEECNDCSEIDDWPEDGACVDCDDQDDEVNPESFEIPYNDIDDDCNGGDILDLDEDGFDALEVGGEDCDDQNALIHPGSQDKCDGIDNDCDGDFDEDEVCDDD